MNAIRFHSLTASSVMLLIMAAQAVAVIPSKEELNQAHTWSQARFAGVIAGKTDIEPPFAFTYGGRLFAEIRTNWTAARTSKKLDDNRTELVTDHPPC